MNFNQNDIGTKVSFDIYGSNIIGGNYKGVRILAIATASAFQEHNPREKHDLIYSTLANPKPQSYTDYMYYLVELSNGKITIVGDRWIKTNTVVKGSTNKIKVIVDDVNSSDIELIQRLLLSSGYKVASIGITTE